MSADTDFRKLAAAIEQLVRLCGPAGSRWEVQFGQLAPFLFRTRKASLPQVAGTNGNELRAWYYHSAARAILIEADAARITGELCKAGIPVYAVKGLGLLAAGVYRNPALRPMSDIDLLIEADRVPAVSSILEGLGYHGVLEYHGSFTFLGKERQVPVDVHTHLVRLEWLFHIDYTEIDRRKRQAPGEAGKEQNLLFLLSPEHQLLQLGLHLAPGLYAQRNLINLVDLYLLVEQSEPPIEWDYMQRLMRDSRTERYMYAPLFHCAKIFGASVPAEVLNACKARLTDTQIRFAETLFLQQVAGGYRNARQVLLDRFLWAPGARGKLQVVRNLRIPGTAPRA